MIARAVCVDGLSVEDGWPTSASVTAGGALTIGVRSGETLVVKVKPYEESVLVLFRD